MAKPHIFTVVFWNVLFDNRENTRVPAQIHRYEKNADTLLGLQKNLDVVCLAETEDSAEHGHLGQKIAQHTGHKHGSWIRHHRKDTEHIGMFGRHVKHVDFVPLSHNATATITSLGAAKVAGIHLTYRMPPNIRLLKQEVTEVLNTLEDTEQAVIMGDFNSLPWQPPRKLLEAHGYRSVFTLLGQRHPITGAVYEYRSLYLNGWQRMALTLTKGFAADDIYIKGNITVKDAGTFRGESDHMGVWATIEI
jgi:endonuclease/exonuclease/phosphatase family metal-dependent hydrolase